MKPEREAEVIGCYRHENGKLRIGDCHVCAGGSGCEKIENNINLIFTDSIILDKQQTKDRENGNIRFNTPEEKYELSDIEKKIIDDAIERHSQESPESTDKDVVKEFKEVEELFPGCEIIHSQEMEDNFREEEEKEVSEPVRSQADERVMMGNQIWYCEVCHFWGVVDWEDGEDVMSVTNRVEKAHKLHGCHNPIRQVRIIREGYPFPKPKDPVIDTDKDREKIIRVKCPDCDREMQQKPNDTYECGGAPFYTCGKCGKRVSAYIYPVK